MDVLSVPYRYAASGWWNFRHPGAFDHIESFILFTGYPRSGHTLIGFLLDAHPNVVVASQTSSLKYLKHGFSKHQIFYVLLQNSRRVAKVGREWRLYSYHVPNQWQGRFDTLRVIGDSTGLTRLRKNPGLLRSLQARLPGVELKLIHCIRNPYDNISTMKLRGDQNLPFEIDSYFGMCEEVERIKQEVAPSAVYDLRHESMIADPKDTLRNICHFLGVSGTDSYYEDCASIVYKSPHRSRLEVKWNEQLIEAVQRRMERFRFLEGYSYADS